MGADNERALKDGEVWVVGGVPGLTKPVKVDFQGLVRLGGVLAGLKDQLKDEVSKETAKDIFVLGKEYVKTMSAMFPPQLSAEVVRMTDDFNDKEDVSAADGRAYFGVFLGFHTAFLHGVIFKKSLEGGQEVEVADGAITVKERATGQYL